MQYFSIIFAGLISFSSLTLASPTPADDNFIRMTPEELAARHALPLEKRTPGGVELCTGTGWTGTCGYAVQPLDTCINLTSPWKNNVGSFGPDPGATCFFYVENNCDEAVAEISYPGTSDVYTYAGELSSSITNFMCE